MLKLRSARVFALAALVLVVSASRGHAQAPKTFTLEEVQRLAAGNYELVNVAREQAKQAEDVRRMAGSARLPTAVFQSVYTHNLISAAFDIGGQHIEVLPANDYNLILSVVQPIFTGLRVEKGYQQAKLGVDLATKSLGITAQDVILDATREYYRVLAARDNVEILRRSLAFAEETLRTSESLYKAGEAVETAVLRARVAVSNAKRELLEAENGLVLARQQLALVGGITGDFDVARPAKPRAAGAPLEDLIKQGLATRGELQAATLQQQIAQLEIEKKKGDWLPTVQAEATYLRRKASFPSPSLSSLAINATWTIFNGGRTGAEVANARSALHAAELSRELLRKQTEQQIRSAYLNVETLSASVDMLTAQVEFARRNADATSKAYKVGEATDLDMLESNAALTQSERQLAMTTYTLDVAMYELQRAVGTFAADLVPAAAGGEQ
jgi:outer membrane protein TolC